MQPGDDLVPYRFTNGGKKSPKLQPPMHFGFRVYKSGDCKTIKHRRYNSPVGETEQVKKTRKKKAKKRDSTSEDVLVYFPSPHPNFVRVESPRTEYGEDFDEKWEKFLEQKLLPLYNSRWVLKSYFNHWANRVEINSTSPRVFCSSPVVDDDVNSLILHAKSLTRRLSSSSIKNRSYDSSISAVSRFSNETAEMDDTTMMSPIRTVYTNTAMSSNSSALISEEI